MDEGAPKRLSGLKKTDRKPALAVHRAYRWHIFAGKLVRGVRNEQACLTDSSIPDNDTLDGLHGSYTWAISNPVCEADSRKPTAQISPLKRPQQLLRRKPVH